MSYSVCISCEKMVSSYEKYCPSCLKQFGLTQDVDFWRNYVYTWEVARQLARTEKAEVAKSRAEKSNSKKPLQVKYSVDLKKLGGKQ